MWQTFIDWDKQLFLFINGHHSPFFDNVMMVFSATWIWTPLFLIILWLLFQSYGLKKTVYLLLFSALLIALSDRTSVVLFKDVFLRLRPCHNPEWEGKLHLINNYCGGQYGFISSHACNHFALVTFLFPLLYKKHKWVVSGLIIWASFVAYSRVYLGVHYPADVFVGSIIGILIGTLISLLIQKTHILQ